MAATARATPERLGRFLALSGPPAALAVLVVALARHRAGIGQALGGASSQVLAGLVAMHLATLVLRTEAWRLILNAGHGTALQRHHVHGASAGAYVAGAIEIHCAMPARVHLLRRLAGPGAPGLTQIVLADLPILLLEVTAAALALAVAGLAAPLAPWWAAPGIAVAATLGLLALAVTHRRRPDGRVARGVAVVADGPRRTALCVLVGVMCIVFVARAWLALSAFGLPDSLADACALYVLLGAFGVLPLGPGASAAATIAAFGSGAFDAATAAGVAITATTFLAVAAYGLLAAGWLQGRARISARRGARS